MLSRNAARALGWWGALAFSAAVWWAVIKLGAWLIGGGR